MNSFVRDIARFLATASTLTEEDAAGLVETPPDSALGDYAVPCFPLAKALRKAPAAIATEIAAAFRPTSHVLSAEAAGPYVNFRVDRTAFLTEVLKSPAAPETRGEGKTIVLDYASPNIAKHLAYHHLRSTCIGFSLKRIFTHLGYETVGINHLGDWGTTHGKLIAAYRHWGRDLDLDTDGVTKLNALYVRFNEEGDEDEGREWFRRLEAGDEEALSLWRRFREISLAEHQEVFDLLGVTFDRVQGESDFVDRLEPTIEKLVAAGLAEISDGALVVRFDDDEMPPLFLRKADGATVYATRDLAAALHRWETWHFARCLYVVDIGQSLHFRQLFATLARLDLPFVDRMEHIRFGLVRFGGKKTGSRKGNVVLLREVLEEAIRRIRDLIEEKNPDLPDRDEVARAVGVGAIIFADLSTRRVKDIDFTWEEVTNFDGHTGPYVQYTHARCASILRRASEAAPDADSDADPALLTYDDEWMVGRLLARFPERVRTAARDAEPSVVAHYLLDLCEAFSRYYNLGNQDPEMKVLAPDPAVAAARLRLVAGVRDVLARGLWLLGMEAPEAM
jgi:arginyl-tRNA synthetase